MRATAKQSGLGDGLLIDQYDVSGDIQSVSDVGGGPAPGEFTGINKFAFERKGLVRDGRSETTNFFNDADDAVHEALSSLPLTDRQITYQRGTSLGSPAACLIAKQGNYDWERAEDGMIIATTQAQGNGYGLQWGRQLTAGRRVDTGATNGTSLDLGTGSTAFGLQAFLHVIGFTGTDATITIEESSDNGVGDAWAAVTDGEFAEVTGVGAEMILTGRTQTVERYLRVATSTTGGFTSLDFVVVVVRNDVAVNF